MIITDLEKSPYIYRYGDFEYFFSTQTRLGVFCKNKDKEIEKLKTRLENITRMSVDINIEDLIYMIYKRFQPDFQLVKKSGQNLNYSKVVMHFANNA